MRPRLSVGKLGKTQLQRTQHSTRQAERNGSKEKKSRGTIAEHSDGETLRLRVGGWL